MWDAPAQGCSAIFRNCTKDFDFESQIVLLSQVVNFQVIKLKTERVQKYFQVGFVFICQNVLEIAGGGCYWLQVVIVNNTSLLIRFEQPPSQCLPVGKLDTEKPDSGRICFYSSDPAN